MASIYISVSLARHYVIRSIPSKRFSTDGLKNTVIFYTLCFDINNAPKSIVQVAATIARQIAVLPSLRKSNSPDYQTPGTLL
jgi:hypothetical protein